MFKVDFQKAFDSVRWDHLDDILGKIGFGDKWRGLIHGCLTSSKASILVNGSPTKEFLFHRGLRQGDPLSPFLFILVMESLHVSFQRLIDRGLFSPILIGKDIKIPISHLFYADDAMFIGKWSYTNVNAVMMMLQWLRNSFFWGADMEDKKITLVRWRKVMAHKQNGGLWINSLYALNLALLFKWIWRFLSSQSDRFWIGILKAIAKLKYKGIDLPDFYKLVIGNGNNTKYWHDKWYEDIIFKEKFHRLFNLESQKDVSVAHKLQCHDLASSFRRPPRSGIEESQLTEISHLISCVVLSPSCDRWSWTLNGLGDFSVKSAR
nr:RNA-directed DNA polymerase, eukaryota, reverse transcriptase zinc-binding domain protein [Tanacetum cinerariifolium]